MSFNSEYLQLSGREWPRSKEDHKSMRCAATVRLVDSATSNNIYIYLITAHETKRCMNHVGLKNFTSD